MPGAGTVRATAVSASTAGRSLFMLEYGAPQLNDRAKTGAGANGHLSVRLPQLAAEFHVVIWCIASLWTGAMPGARANRQLLYRYL